MVSGGMNALVKINNHPLYGVIPDEIPSTRKKSAKKRK